MALVDDLPPIRSGLTQTAGNHAEDHNKLRAAILAVAEDATIPEGGFRVGVTDDPAVADANPSIVWLIIDTVGTGDETPPTVPTGLAVTNGNGQVELEWDAVSDAVSYRVYRDTVLIASPTSPTYLDTDVVNLTSYSYTVSAVDASSNESAVTAPIVGEPQPGAGEVGYLIASDTFNRADTAFGPTGLGTASDGGTYTIRTGDAGIIDDHAGIVGADGATTGYALRSVATTDQDVSITVVEYGTSFDVGIGRAPVAVARDTAAGHASRIEWGFTVHQTAGAGSYDPGFELRYADAGVQLASRKDRSPAPGDVLRLVVKGTNAKAYLNGEKIADVTVAAPGGTQTFAGFGGRAPVYDRALDDLAIRQA
jgi:hypothetical protein